MESKTLIEADKIIHGERQDVYGNPEDSFLKVARFWTAYIANKADVRVVYENGHFTPLTFDEKDVALMMTLFKFAREQGTGHKRDNAVDACGYLAIYNDRLQKEQPEKTEEEIGHEEMKKLWEEHFSPYPAFFSDLKNMCERVEVNLERKEG